MKSLVQLPMTRTLDNYSLFGNVVIVASIFFRTAVYDVGFSKFLDTVKIVIFF